MHIESERRYLPNPTARLPDGRGQRLDQYYFSPSRWKRVKQQVFIGLDPHTPLAQIRLPEGAESVLDPLAHHTLVARVRMLDNQAFFTIKGPKQNGSGVEVECRIPLDTAAAARVVADAGMIEKHRQEIIYSGVVVEIDRFDGMHHGLVLIEVENEPVGWARPAWIGQDITDDPRYANARLATNRAPLPDKD